MMAITHLSGYHERVSREGLTKEQAQNHADKVVESDDNPLPDKYAQGRKFERERTLQEVDRLISFEKDEEDNDYNRGYVHALHTVLKEIKRMRP